MRLPIILPAILAALVASAAPAQEAGEGTATPPGISGVGSAKLTCEPTAMRLSVEFRVDGKDLKEALANLKTRRETIKAGLAKLGADEKSIEIGTPRADSALDARARAMQARSGRPPAKATTGPAPATIVSVDVRADFPLAAGDADARLLAVTELQKKITDAKLFEFKPPAAKTEEDEEREGMEMSSSDGGPRPGEPTFYFVAPLTPENTAKATQEAFAKAKANAESLAKAAGVTLGAPRALQTFSPLDTILASYEYQMIQQTQYAGYGGYRRMPSMPPMSREEAMTSTLGPISHTITVRAIYNFSK